MNLRKSKAVFVMFGGYWSYLPAVLGRYYKKPVFIIPGGSDCVSFPSIKYGSYNKVLLKKFIYWSFKRCTELLPVHESLVITENLYFESDIHPKQGYLNYFPDIKTPFTIIFNGFDPEFWKPVKNVRMKNSFITVAPISSMLRYKIKGIDVIFYLAEKYSDCTFTIVGMSHEFKNTIARIPGNVVIHDFLKQDDFKEILAKNEFYLQLSLTEGFPNSLCEGMLSGCIPVGSNVGAIPLIIGETGIVIKKHDYKYIDEEFGRIIQIPDDERIRLSSEARERIASNFNISKREQAFLEIILKHTVSN